MRLCVDVGNTFIKFGLFRAGKLIRKKVIAHDCIVRLAEFLDSLRVSRLTDVVICSVVPRMSAKIARIVKKKWCLVPYEVNENCAVTLRSHYSNETPLGNDRIMALYGALCSYPLPVIIVSFGTAITVDAVFSDGIHRGGFIIPGIKTAATALAGKTALLPDIVLKKTNISYGKNTTACINAGVLYGTASAIDGLVGRLQACSGTRARVIATGGDAALMAQYCMSIDHVVHDHVLNALCMLGENIVGQGS